MGMNFFSALYGVALTCSGSGLLQCGQCFLPGAERFSGAIRAVNGKASRRGHDDLSPFADDEYGSKTLSFTFVSYTGLREC